MSRNKAKNNVFGEPKELKDYELPTLKDVMQHISWVKSQEPAKKPILEIAKTTADRVMVIWKKASIPTVHKTTVVKRINAYLEKVRNIQRSAGRKGYEEEVQKLQEESTALFDICSCKCPLPEKECKCPAESKVPHLELEFLMDQRGDRKMRISSVDRKTTAILQKRNARRVRDVKKENEPTTTVTSATASASHSLNSSFTSEHSSSSDVEGSASNTDSDFEPGPSMTNRGKTQARLPLPHLTSAAYRAGVTLRQAALLASASLHDFKNEMSK